MLTPKTASKYTAEVYHFRFPQGRCDWAIFSICEATGEFSIQSDWGAFAYRWDISALGVPTMKQFLARCDADYILRKMRQNNKGLDDVLDDEKTLKRFQEFIISERKQSRFEKTQARDLWESAKRFCDDIDGCGVDAAVMNIDRPLDHLIGGDYSAWLAYRKSGAWEFFDKELLPFFFGVLRKELADDQPKT